MKRLIGVIIGLNILLYLCISFVKWDMLWYEEIPNWQALTRGFFIYCFIVIQILFTITSSFLKPNKS